MSANLGVPAQKSLYDDGLEAKRTQLVESGADSPEGIADLAYFGILGAAWTMIVAEETDPWMLFPDESSAGEALAAALLIGGAAAVAAASSEDEARKAQIMWGNLKSRFKVNAIVFTKSLTKSFIVWKYAIYVGKNYPTLNFAVADILSDCGRARVIAEKIARDGYLARIIEENNELREVFWPADCKVRKAEKLIDVIARDIGRLAAQYRIKKVTFNLVKDPMAFFGELFRPIGDDIDGINEEVEIEPRLLLMIFK